MFRLDGKEFFGVVVDWDDPEKMGRVKVGIPSIMGNKVEISKLPWLSIFSDKPDSFDRPPQPGTIVSVMYPHGSGAVNGIVRNVINGIHQASGAGIDLNQKLNWLHEALNFKPDISAPPDTRMVEQGKKIIQEVVEKGNVLPLAERINIPTTLVSPALVPIYDAITSVSTAVDNGISSLNSLLSIPGQIVNMGNLVPNSSPISGPNFISMGLRGNNFDFNTLLSNVKSFAEFENLVRDVRTNPVLRGLDGLFPVKVGIPGIAEVTINIDGAISIDFLDQFKSILETLTGNITSVMGVTGGMLTHSDITKSIDRLHIDIAQEMRNKLSQIGNNINKAVDKSQQFFGGVTS